MWDHEPTAGELLERRLAHGWMPTPSHLTSGDRILGYAGCVVTTVPHRTSGGVVRR